MTNRRTTSNASPELPQEHDEPLKAALLDEAQVSSASAKSEGPAEAGAAMPEPAESLAATSVASESESEIAVAPTTVSETAGNVDVVDGRIVRGWALLKSGTSVRPVSVELLLDGKVVTVGKADILRLDLKAAGVGDGAHAFELHVPEDQCDGSERKLDVRVRETGSLLSSDVRSIHLPSPGTLTYLELEGTTIVGRGLPPRGGFYVNVIAVEESGRLLASTGDIARHGEEIEFHLPLPASACDGGVHYFQVRAGETGPRLGELAVVTPFIATPIEVIARHGGGAKIAALWPSGRQRYDALVGSVRKIAGRATQKAASGIAPAVSELENLATAHEAVARGFEAAGQHKASYQPLRFPVVAAPDVSLVVPVHNKFAVTYHCLASLLLAPNEASFEVVVVDDGSSDETKGLGEIVSGLTILRNEVGQGFIRASNRGGTAARGKYVVMLNNDTEVAAHWLDELLWPFDHFENVGMTGAKLIYPNGRLQEAGGIIWGNGDPWNYGRNGNARDPRCNYTRQVDYISGACVMLPKPLWDEIGGFDELFLPAYFEDTDLAFRVRQKGLKTVYTPFAEVIHFEGMSSGTSVQSGTKRYQEINRPKFKARWANAFRPNGPVGRDVELAKDRHAAYRALVIDYAVPRPDHDAGSYAAIQEMRLLQSLGFKLTFVPENMAYMGSYTDALQRTGIECVYAPFNGSVQEVIEKRGAEFDVIYITRYSVAEKYIEAIRQYAPSARIVFNNADLHFLRELRQAIGLRDREMLQRALRTRDSELAVMRQVDLVLSYNEVEHAVIMSHNLDSTLVAKCPWVVDVPAQVPGFAARKDIAFLGGYGHPPNLEAVKFFIAEVMPLLRKTLPGVRFLVYGSNVPKELEDMADADVVIAGWVEEVAEVYDTCRVFVASLKSGAGLKGKVLGALSHGVPSVISPIAAEGIGAADGIDLVVADKPEEWAQAITTLYQDAAAWDAMAKAAQAFVRKRYSFTVGRELMKSALEKANIFTADDHQALWA